MIKHSRMYDSPDWRAARKAYLRQHPLCVMCKQFGRVTPAKIVDHIKPHKNNYEMFWDQDNWESLCASCHSGIKRVQDIHGYSQACDASGVPLNANHPWNKR